MFEHLRATDPETTAMIEAELLRERTTLDLIASENIASPAILDALGSPLTNKYAEGYPGRRYYAGNVQMDSIERLAVKRAKDLFGAEHANVQPHSGSQANAAAYSALAKPCDTILSMSLAHGGHLTHGSPASAVSKTYRFVHYGVNQNDERIDMTELRNIALREKPKVIVAGATAYPRTIDFSAFRAIADECGAYLMVDMAHIAGLVAAGVHPSPVPHADVVTLTTHKTLRGPRGGMILCRTEDRLDPTAKRTLASRIDSAVFPGQQGGPLMHAVTAKAVALHEAADDNFRAYQKNTIANAQALASTLSSAGLRIVSGGTDTHLVLVDLTSLGIFGKEAEERLEAVGIITNRNMIPFDPRTPTDPSGLRLGTPTLTTRGMGTNEMNVIANAIIAVLKNSESGIATATETVSALCRKFPLYPELP